MSFRESIKDFKSAQPNSNIILGVENNSHRLNDLEVINKNVDKLALTEYKRCYNIYERRFSDKIQEYSGMGGFYRNATMYLYSNVMSSISLHENPLKEKLEALAERVMRDIYNIPDSIDIIGKIKGNVKDEGDEDGFDPSSACEEDDNAHNLPISDERREYIEKEAKKRKLLNTISQGSSVHIWKTVFHMCKEELDEMNPSLMQLYNEYSGLVSILLWSFDPGFMDTMIENGSVMNQGYNKVTKGEDEEEDDFFDDEMQAEYQKFLEEQEIETEEDSVKAKSVAINFPVLLHEINKSVFEIFKMHSIPADLSDDEMNLYYSLSDDYRNEFWMYYLGPTLWTSILDVVNSLDIEVSEMMLYLNGLSYENLSTFCDLSIKDTEKAVDLYNMMTENV